MDDDTVIDVCDACGGDGEFDEPAAWIPTTIKCTWCDGAGFIVRAAEPAGEEWIDETNRGAL